MGEKDGERGAAPTYTSNCHLKESTNGYIRRAERREPPNGRLKRTYGGGGRISDAWAAAASRGRDPPLPLLRRLRPPPAADGRRRPVSSC